MIIQTPKGSHVVYGEKRYIAFLKETTSDGIPSQLRYIRDVLPRLSASRKQNKFNLRLQFSYIRKHADSFFLDTKRIRGGI